MVTSRCQKPCWNQYLYCRNDPVNLFDPNGEWSFNVSVYAKMGATVTIGQQPDTGQFLLTVEGGGGYAAGLSLDLNGKYHDPPAGESDSSILESACVGISGYVGEQIGPVSVGGAADGMIQV